MPSHFIDEVDAEVYDHFVTEGRAPLILPTGATEQHGPHMPLGVDAMLSRAISGLVAEHLGAMVAPTFSFGYKSQPRSGGGSHRRGTISLQGETLIQYAADVIGGFFEDGVDRIVIINGHYENYQFLYEGMDTAVRRARGQSRDISGMLLSYWDFVDEDTLATVFPDGFLGWDIEHGGVLETSMMLHLFPHLVDMERAPAHPPASPQPYDIFPEDPARTPASGCLSSPEGASAQHGELLLQTVVRRIAKAVQSEIMGDSA